MFSHKKQLPRKILILPCTFIMAALIACTFEVGVLEPTQTPYTQVEKVVQEIDLEVKAGTTDQEGAQLPPSEADAGCQGSLLAGLVFTSRDQNGEVLWQVGTCGGFIQLATQSDVRISPNGSQALFTQNDDIWIVDILNGDQQNLTKTPDRIETGPQWWPGNDDLVIFGSWDSGEDMGFRTGYLSLVTIDGSDYRVLVDQPSNANPAPQPGGSMIAYDLGASLISVDIIGRSSMNTL